MQRRTKECQNEWGGDYDCSARADLEDLSGDWRRLDERIENLSSEIEALACQDKGCERLMTIPASARSINLLLSDNCFLHPFEFGPVRCF